MLLFAKQLNEQFKYLDYESTFLFCKINEYRLFDLIDDTLNSANERGKDSALKVADKLLLEGGHFYGSSLNSDDSGILVRFKN
jgi:hypothetical protein